jgi:hypothetical protein
MKQIRRPSFIQTPLKKALLEIVASLPAYPKEGQILLDKTGGTHNNKVVVFVEDAWRSIGAAEISSDVFTPVISFGTGVTGITYTSRSGFYWKISNMVFVQLAITLSSKGTDTGLIRIGGLPFNNSLSPVLFNIKTDNVKYVTDGLELKAKFNGTNRDYLNLYCTRSEDTVGTISNIQIEDTSAFEINGWYPVYE